MEFPAVFPWQALPEVASGHYAPYTIDTILAVASTRGIDPNIAEHLARIVLERIKDLSVGFEGRLTKAQASIAARTRLAEEAVRLDNSHYLGRAVVEASQIQQDLILGIIEDAIEKSDLGGPNVDDVDTAGEELKKTTTSQEEEPRAQEKRERGVQVKEIVTNGRHRTKFVFSQAILDKHFDGRDPYGTVTAATEQFSALNLNKDTACPLTCAESHNGKDLLTAICSSIELAVELGKYLSAHDILNLYIASSTFRGTINNYMLSSVRIWIKDRCPEAGRVFPFNMYKKYLIPDPTGRTWGDVYKDAAPASLTAEKRDKVRTIPGMKYLQLVLGRDRYVREIIAIMAREGHLMPEGMYNALLRVWLTMDITTTNHRVCLLRNKKLWTDQDLYNAQLFFVKLTMHMNDPVFGPGTLDLTQLFMGQKGLYKLWQLLFRKRWASLRELIDLKVRYDYDLNNGAWQRCLSGTRHFHGVPMHLVGKLHREGYGTMNTVEHLSRPDELVPQEAIVRGLQLDRHLRHMMLWGYFNWRTGENIVPTEEQMYLSDEEETLANISTTHHWRKKHAMKKRWHELTEAQKQEIRGDDDDEDLRCQAWGYWGEQDDEDEDLNDYESDSGSEYSLNEELRRGYLLPEQPRDQKSSVPAKDDKKGWKDFVSSVLIGAPPKLDIEWMQRLHMDNKVNDERYDERFDWRGWMKAEGFKLEDLMSMDGEGDVAMSQ